jgi:hypothetical protein
MMFDGNEIFNYLFEMMIEENVMAIERKVMVIVRVLMVILLI